MTRRAGRCERHRRTGKHGLMKERVFQQRVQCTVPLDFYRAEIMFELLSGVFKSVLKRVALCVDARYGTTYSRPPSPATPGSRRHGHIATA
ncbi:hypothetical protein LMG28614_01289 [Paraburkholderia ultramafica]|uniref:Uncharacterized protein n=1 Tax=Paraburkholderia ultramafica TaxID=1544867 RepID=A0A6S7B740_9BURK|nr:hypothetical protein LMG28614_01289 [Paraburkholderia ultramafica]